MTTYHKGRNNCDYTNAIISSAFLSLPNNPISIELRDTSLMATVTLHTTRAVAKWQSVVVHATPLACKTRRSHCHDYGIHWRATWRCMANSRKSTAGQFGNCTVLLSGAPPESLRRSSNIHATYHSMAQVRSPSRSNETTPIDSHHCGPTTNAYNTWARLHNVCRRMSLATNVKLRLLAPRIPSTFD